MNYNPPCVIFDIDGTLANVSHRTQYVQINPKNWKAFNAAMVHDVPNKDIVWLVRTFYAVGSKILISSGRGAEDRDKTVHWLDNVANIAGLYEKLYMRPLDDDRRDDIVKSEILDQMLLDGYNPTIAVDDRDQVVNMFRSRGLRVLQVAPGNF